MTLSFGLRVSAEALRFALVLSFNPLLVRPRVALGRPCVCFVKDANVSKRVANVESLCMAVPIG
jgi:hypothetical protein